MTARYTYTEQELTTLLKSNDRSAFEYLYDHYSPALYGIIVKIVKDEERACDAMQDTFLKIWKNISSYNSEKGTLFTWILNIARNTAIDKLRVEVKKEKIEPPNPKRMKELVIGPRKRQKTIITYVGKQKKKKNKKLKLRKRK